MNKYEDLIIKEHTLKYDVKFWICENPFSSNNIEILHDYISKIPDNFQQNMFNKNPISVNVTENDLNNIPFINDLRMFMIRFFKNNFESKYRPIIKEHKLKPTIVCWINKYSNEIDKTSNKKVLLPHIDGKVGIVANLWLSKNISSSSTKLFKYDGEIIVEEIEDNNGRLMNEKIRILYSNHLDLMKENTSNIITYKSWINLQDEEFEKNGFEYLGNAPSIYSHMSIYEINTPHIPYIPPDVKERNALAIMLCF